MFVPNKILTGKRIRDLRKQAGLSRDDVAGFLNISPQAVGKYERGEALPCLTHAQSMALLFGTSMDDFLAGKYTNMEGREVIVMMNQNQKRAGTKEIVFDLALFVNWALTSEMVYDLGDYCFFKKKEGSATYLYYAGFLKRCVYKFGVVIGEWVYLFERRSFETTLVDDILKTSDFPQNCMLFVEKEIEFNKYVLEEIFPIFYENIEPSKEMTGQYPLSLIRADVRRFFLFPETRTFCKYTYPNWCEKNECKSAYEIGLFNKSYRFNRDEPYKVGFFAPDELIEILSSPDIKTAALSFFMKCTEIDWRYIKACVQYAVKYMNSPEHIKDWEWKIAKALSYYSKSKTDEDSGLQVEFEYNGSKSVAKMGDSAIKFSLLHLDQFSYPDFRYDEYGDTIRLSKIFLKMINEDYKSFTQKAKEKYKKGVKIPPTPLCCEHICKIMHNGKILYDRDGAVELE